MMSSWNGNIFRVTGHLCGEFYRSSVNSPHKGQWRGALMFSLICAWINDWVNSRGASELRRHRAHNNVIIMATACNYMIWRLTRKLFRIIGSFQEPIIGVFVIVVNFWTNSRYLWHVRHCNVDGMNSGFCVHNVTGQVSRLPYISDTPNLHSHRSPFYGTPAILFADTSSIHL